MIRRRSGPFVALIVAGLALVLGSCGGHGERVADHSCEAPTPPSPGEAWQAPDRPVTFQVILAQHPFSYSCGQFRLVFGLVDGSGRSIGSTDRPVQVGLFDFAKDVSRPVAISSTRFEPAREGSGMYVATIDIAHGGSWGVEVEGVDVSGTTARSRAVFTVRTPPIAKMVGDQAPSVETPTAGSVAGALDRISTDPVPDPALYSSSEATLLASGTPFVLVIASAGYCPSQQCLAVLEIVKRAAKEHPDITFVHAEPALLVDTGDGMKPAFDSDGVIRTAPVVDAFGVLTEPWIYVVDRHGRIVGSFEAVVDESELADAIASATR